MASVFKRGGKRAKGYWYASWFDHNGKRHTKCTRTTDKATAERIAKKYEADAALRREGVIDPAQDRYAQEAARPIDHHVADFCKDLLARDRTPKHVDMTVSRVQFIIERCSTTHASLVPSEVQEAISSIRDAGRSLETCNSYLRAIKSFSKWLRREKRMPDDPLATLKAYNTSTDPRHVRRELTNEELGYLLNFVEGHTKPTHNMAGPDRAMLYRAALGTGFRAGELRSLKRDSFDLASDSPAITVEAAYSKRRRQDQQPIRADLAELLRPWLEGFDHNAHVFGRMPRNMAKSFRADLAAARAEWIEAAETKAEKERRQESDFLRYEDSIGRVIDFHATRHTYISNVVASGASVKTAQELSRHSDPRLTINRYSHTRLHDLRQALESGPDLSGRPTDADVLKATGTDGADSIHAQRRRSSQHAIQVPPVRNSANKKRNERATPGMRALALTCCHLRI